MNVFCYIKDNILTSLNKFMKRGPYLQGLCLWHCRELTVIWVARWDATATMNTASYMRAASVCGRREEFTHKTCSKYNQTSHECINIHIESVFVYHSFNIECYVMAFKFNFLSIWSQEKNCAHTLCFSGYYSVLKCDLDGKNRFE